jgi:hypothetical protein
VTARLDRRVDDAFHQFIITTWLALACAIVPAHAEKRVALVIGNDRYANLAAEDGEGRHAVGGVLRHPPGAAASGRPSDKIRAPEGALTIRSVRSAYSAAEAGSCGGCSRVFTACSFSRSSRMSWSRPVATSRRPLITAPVPAGIRRYAASPVSR